MKYDQAVIVGTGTLALFCAVMLRDAQLPVCIYDMEQQRSSMLKRSAPGQGIPYTDIKPREAFAQIAGTDRRTLLVSAINPEIVPDRLLANPCITAINCHQALLPRHPGRNAEMWALYEGDAKTGVTWHMLTAQVDAGDILIQKEMEITSSHTSYQIFREQIGLAKSSFAEMFPGLLSGTLAPRPQEALQERKMHYSREVPNGGYLDPNWDAGQISRFLRAMDYGLLHVVPQPRIRLGAEEYTWKKYEIAKEQRFSDGVFCEKAGIYLQKPGTLFILSF